MDYVNISNGMTDGFVLFYLKGGKLCSVLLTAEQATMLDLVLDTVFGDQSARVVPVDDVIVRGMM